MMAERRKRCSLGPIGWEVGEGLKYEQFEKTTNTVDASRDVLRTKGNRKRLSTAFMSGYRILSAMPEDVKLIVKC